MKDDALAIRIDVRPDREVSVLVAEGLLDSSTYRTVRNAVIEAAINEPRAVIVDVNRVSAPSASAWKAFTSARWHVSIWPNVPILLTCAQPQMRQAIAAGGVTRYVPVHHTREVALNAVRDRSFEVRSRARTELLRSRGSLALARAFVSDRLTEWGSSELIPAAATVATVFVENVLDHTESAPALIVERCQDTATVAVDDASASLPGRHEDPGDGAEIVSGLSIVRALCRAWGSTPTSAGKTVWALIGREKRL